MTGTNSDGQPHVFVVGADGLDVQLRQSALIGDLLGEFELAGRRLFDAVRNTQIPVVRRVGYLKFLEAIGQFQSGRFGPAAPVGVPGVDRRPRWRGICGTIQRGWRGADRSAQRVASWLTPRKRLVGTWWTWGGLLLTGLVGLLVHEGVYLVALLGLAVRVAMSTAAGNAPTRYGTAGVINLVECRDIWFELRQCLASHASDAVLLSAISAALQSAGRPGWAQLAAVSCTIALLGTLARVGAERGGARVTRSIIERVFRTGGFTAALALSAATRGGDVHLGAWSVPPLALAAVGMLTYGLIEISRVLIGMTFETAPVSAITVAATESGTRLDGYVNLKRVVG